MKTTTRFLLTFYLLLATAQRLPAPISEAPQPTPIPKPMRQAAPKPKPESQPTAKPKATPNRSFAGTWRGTTIDKASDGESSYSDYIIKISDDEKTVLVNCTYAGQNPNGPPLQFSCSRFRDALVWSLSDSGGTTTYTMRINSNGTANLLREGKHTGGDYDGITYTHTGTLSREGASPVTGPQTTVSSAPQTALPTTMRNSGDLPIAKPVPNKPGFVYNPFDPNSKVLLDVRGRASGTKLKDPFSGKLFITP